MSLPLTGAGPSGPGVIAPDAVSGLAAWFKADALALADAAAVSSWTDSSGNARHATQGTGSKQPTYRTNVVNSKPVVRFDGTDDVLETTGFTLNQPETVFIVATFRSARVANDTLIDGATTNNMRVFRTVTGLQQYAGANGPHLTLDPEGWHVYSFIYNGASSEARYDGANLATGNPSTNNAGGIAIGGNGTLGTENAPVDVAEIAVYSSALSEANRSGIERHLGLKYGITVP